MDTIPSHLPASAPQRGMSLIEILVGLAIALVGMLIMFQVFSAAGERNLTTVGGNEAQISGSLGLFSLERDIKLAGYGFGMIPESGTDGGVAGCSVAAHNSNLSTQDFNFTLTPVQIIDGAGGAPDQLVVNYGNSAYSVVPRLLDRSAPSPSTPVSKTLVDRGGMHNGDMLLVTSDASDPTSGLCALVEVTGTANLDGRTVDHIQDAVYSSFYTGTNTTAHRNAAGGTATFVASAGQVYNLGPSPSRNVWRVTQAGDANFSPGQLVWRNSLIADPGGDLPVTDGIVDLQAQYGVDSQATGVAGHGQITDAEWTSADPADWSRVLAIRVALLSRNQQVERDAVTTVAPTWAHGSNTFVMRNVDGTADSHPGDGNDWRHYRYRVYEATVPLRNMIWGSTPLPAFGAH